MYDAIRRTISFLIMRWSKTRLSDVLQTPKQLAWSDPLRAKIDWQPIRLSCIS
jgi:hypothetical protein